MNILLLYPEIPATFRSFKYALKFIAKKSLHPPFGLLKKGRRYYWSLFVRSLFRRPSYFGRALTYAINGYHYRKVFNIQ